MADIPAPVRQLVVDGLAAADLHGGLFDIDVIASDLADRLMVDADLDGFIGAGDPGAPAVFDALDPR